MLTTTQDTHTHTDIKMHSLLSGPINHSRAEAELLLYPSALWSSCRPFGPTALSALHTEVLLQLLRPTCIYSFQSQRLMPYLYACTDSTFSICVGCLVVNCYSHATSQRPSSYGNMGWFLHLEALEWDCRDTPHFLIFGVLVKCVSRET